MAETSVPVQPASPAPTAAPIQVKLVSVPDGANIPGVAPGAVQLQAFALYDDQGRAIAPMTEATGQAIVRLLATLVRIHADQFGGLVPSDETGLSGQG